MLRRLSFGKYEVVRPPPAPLRPPSRWIVAMPVSDVVVAMPKAQIVRSVAYLRVVAALPCRACGLHGHSQAAHVPAAGKGMKQSDLETFPLCCTRVGVPGCHFEFDQYRMFGSQETRRVGLMWAAETRALIERKGLWPKNLTRMEIA